MSAQLAELVTLALPEMASRGLVLHVDDDEAMRRSTAMLLRIAGFDTREAESGEHALTQAECLRGKLDVLIVDYHLGNGLTGTEVAEEFARGWRGGPLGFGDSTGRDVAVASVVIVESGVGRDGGPVVVNARPAMARVEALLRTTGPVG